MTVTTPCTLMETCHALIVDDEADLRELIAMTLLPLGVECHSTDTLGEAYRLLKRHTFQFCITDLRLPDGNGLELVAHIQKQYAHLPVAVITAHGNIESAVEALKLGAFDFVSKPFDLSVLRTMVNTALRLQKGHQGDISHLTESSHQNPVLLGQSSAMEDVRGLIAKLSRSQAPVLISGESGTGKELAARMIHRSGPRVDQPFVPVNCGAIPEHLMESEFFGYKKGSFTGATQDKGGLFQAAQGGTLFLDEVADLPLAMQVKLLRAIQERAVRPVGAAAEVAIDVRVLSATHKNLQALVREGAFRQDLFYRLNVIEIRLPSLREHPDDIPELVTVILDRLSRYVNVQKPAVLPGAFAALCRYYFPGNIRELENILERAFTLCDGHAIREEDLLLPSAEASEKGASDGALTTCDLEGYLEGIEKAAIVQALETTRHNKTAAAEKLGITFRALRYRLKKLGLE